MILWDPVNAEGTLAGLRLVMFIAADDLNFKNGAFRGRFTANTKPIDAIDIFLHSDHFSQEERGLLHMLRCAILGLLGQGPNVASGGEIVTPFFMMIAKDTSVNGGDITLDTFMAGNTKRDAVFEAVQAEKHEKERPPAETTGETKENAQSQGHLDKAQPGPEGANDLKGKSDDVGSSFKNALRGAFR